jgi:signal transduction histidine kinase
MVPPSPKPRRVLLAVTLATIAIFGGLMALLTWQLRKQLREQVLGREAEAISAVALMHLARGETRLSQFSAEFAIDDLFDAVLESSKLRDVIAVQLFDARGKLRKASTIAPDDVEASLWWSRTVREPKARFIANGSWEMVSPLMALQTGVNESGPLLDIVVPLASSVIPAANSAVALYWIDGANVARDFKRLDRGLAVQAGIAFAGGAALLAFVLAWAFSRLDAANRQLVEQSLDLARANQELDFAAKTGALGAITAHLIHGLKNPLAGIEGFVAETATSSSDAMRGEACRTAIETTQRLRALVTEVTAVLRDESDGSADYAVPIGEVVAAAAQRATPAAERADVGLKTFAEPDLVVGARVANLAGLVLANLIANAIEASPRGSAVTIEARRANDAIELTVADNGPGIPAALQSELFRPVRSSKRGGGGVGLAISMRLAKHAGGTLELVRSDRRGTEFRLAVPVLVRA